MVIVGHSFLYSFYFLFYFIFGCIGSLLLCTGFLQLWRAGATLRCGAHASHFGGFSCCGARALGTQASVVVVHGLSSCGSRAQLLRGMCDLPGLGIETVSPALASEFLTTAPPGKSLYIPIIGGRGEKCLHTLCEGTRALCGQVTCSCYPVLSLSCTSTTWPCVQAGGALRSSHPGPAVPQRGAPKHSCAILQMGELGPEEVREGNLHETTS